MQHYDATHEDLDAKLIADMAYVTAYAKVTIHIFIVKLQIFACAFQYK